MKILQKDHTLFLGNPFFQNPKQANADKLAQRKQLHRKEAMHVVTSTFQAEKRRDEEGEGKLNEHIQMLQKENESYNAFINDAKDQMDQLAEEYGVDKDSQEQKDLEILKKLQDKLPLTEEEAKRMPELGEMTEYQKQALELHKQASFYKKKMEDNQSQIKGDTQAIRSMKIEKLKSKAMVEAQQAKEDIMDAASKEAIAMMMQDAKETLDEKAEEIKEEAEKREEKKEEQEERIEAAKETKTEAEAAAENVREKTEEMTKQTLDGEDITREIDEEVKKLMEEENLLLEDLKGISLDAKA